MVATKRALARWLHYAGFDSTTAGANTTSTVNSARSSGGRTLSRIALPRSLAVAAPAAAARRNGLARGLRALAAAADAARDRRGARETAAMVAADWIMRRAVAALKANAALCKHFAYVI